jgi:hypothetical protein
MGALAVVVVQGIGEGILMPLAAKGDLLRVLHMARCPLGAMIPADALHLMRAGLQGFAAMHKRVGAPAGRLQLAVLLLDLHLTFPTPGRARQRALTTRVASATIHHCAPFPEFCMCCMCCMCCSLQATIVAAAAVPA